MLLRTKLARALTCALILAMFSCDSPNDECTNISRNIPGVEVYSYGHESSGETIELHLDKDDMIQLGRLDNDGRLIAGSRVEAQLTTAALDLLGAAATELETSGSPGSYDLQCLSFVDPATVRMVVQASQSRLEFGYPWQCAPSALAPVDSMFQELTLALSECGSSEFYTGCSILE